MLQRFFLIGLSLSAMAQSTVQDADSKLLNWHNKDVSTDTVVGISTEKAYNELLNKKKSKTVIVAIIDSGVDIEHPDIKDKVWINEDEIPNNGLDDDKNGYIDDVYGWSFLGNDKGENIDQETLEMTRIYRKYASKYDKLKPSEISKNEKETYALYQRAKTEFIKKLTDAKMEEASVKVFYKNYNDSDSLVKAFLKKDSVSIDDIKSIKTEDEKLQKAVQMMTFLTESNFKKEDIQKYLDHAEGSLKYNLNVNFNPRNIIGDNPEIWDGKPYGSKDVKGPDPSHGTHVAGIVAASRKNGFGIDGIADNVRIMSVRAVPDGDERDKDIAMAIRYAVDNGAEVINMSFGKAYSPEKVMVDEAVKYAEQKGVILVHAAGNDAQNTDKQISYPSKYYANSELAATNWLSIGASTSHKGETLPAFFSNYGKKTVDIFAPGHEIYSLKPNNRYEANSGTSMAAPMVTGLAALIKSYYPTLSHAQIINIILESGTNLGKEKVSLPGGRKKMAVAKKTKFKKLSKTGSVINAYKAIQMAEMLIIK